jgi:hypothetical protein
MSTPARKMGNTSSQLGLDNSQEHSAPLNTAQSSLPVEDDKDTTMDDPALRAERVKKRRNVSGDATRPLKRPKKDREQIDTVVGASDTNELGHEDHTGDGQEHAAIGEIAQKPSKKRSRKEHTMRGEDDALAGRIATQDSLILEETPQSTADTAMGGDTGKRVKSKRKRPTGRPSGLNLVPEGMSDLAMQEEVIQESQLSPEMTNVQSSHPGPRKTKSPKTAKAQPNGISGNDYNNDEPSPVFAKATKSPKASKKRRSALRDENAAEMFPTPPEATQNDEAPDLPEVLQAADDNGLRHDYVEVDATSQVQGWLSSQMQDGNTPTTPRFDIPDSAPRKKAKLNASAQREITSHPDEPKRTKKHRRDSRHLEDDSEDYQVEEDDSVKEKPRKSTQKKSKRSEKIVSDEDASDPGPTPVKAKSHKKKEASSRPAKSSKKAAPDEQLIAKGPFTGKEKTKVDNLFNETMKDTGMSDADLRLLIKNWKSQDAADFKEAVQAALPNRPIAAIRKFCQRRYHNMERGSWTPEDDASLKNAYTANPDKWTEISSLVGRTGADCKDRWKNYVSNEGTLQVGPWSREEADALRKAVNETIKELQKKDKGNKNLSRDELERVISWDAVSKKLNCARSAKRCNEKWQKIKRDQGASRSSTSAPPLATGLVSESTGVHSTSKKLRLIESKYNECDVGDLYDILTEIHTAIPDHSKHYDHESTLWAIIATKNPGSRFKSGMRRRGLHDAAQVYKNEIGEQSTIAATAKALAEHLEEQWGTEVLKEKRSYDPKSKERTFKSSEQVVSDNEDNTGEEEKVGTETPPTSHQDESQDQEEDQDEDEETDELAPEAEVPDSQPVDSKPRVVVESPISFKSINKRSKGNLKSAAIEQATAAAEESKPARKARSKARKA